MRIWTTDQCPEGVVYFINTKHWKFWDEAGNLYDGEAIIEMLRRKGQIIELTPDEDPKSE